MIDAVTTAFIEGKTALVALTGLSRDALHMHIGLVILFAARLPWRGRRSGWLVGGLAVLAFAVAGEWMDRRGSAMVGDVTSWAGHWHDIWNTMLWPTLLAAAGWWTSPDAPSDESAEDSLEQA